MPATTASVSAADPIDEMGLAPTALAAPAELVVSGPDENNLLALGNDQSISIVTAAQALKRISA